MRRLLIAVVMGILPFCAGANAADFPSRPIQIIVPFGPGTALDVSGRVLAEQIQKDTNATVIIQNLPGANGLLGANRVLSSRPDGYTLLLSSNSTLSLGSAMWKDVTYDSVKDFTHIGLLATNAVVLAVGAESEFKTLDDLVKFAKANPGKLTYGHSSASTMIVGAVFTSQTKISAIPVAYKASTQILSDLLGKQISYGAVDVASSQAMVKSGRLRLLAVLGPERSRIFPEISTVGELGYPAIRLVGWNGLSAPAGIPNDAKDWLVKNARGAMSDRALRDKLEAAGSGTDPEVDFDLWVRDQQTEWQKAAADAGIKPE